jgi:predicted RNA-binding protein associated with RNAse of E/G family
MSLIHGLDSTDAQQPIAVDSDGNVQVDVLSAALPSGASTEATLVTVLARLTSLTAALLSVATDLLRVNVIAALPAGTNNIGDVDVLSSALPAGASTEATLATRAAETTAAAIETAVEALANALVSVATDTLRANIIAALPAGTNNIGDVDVLSSALPAGAATSAKQDTQITAEQAIQAATEIVDDWDESDRAKVNPIVGQAGITAGAGAVAANTPRVTLASDDPAVTALQILDNVVSGSEAQVDVVAPLPAGTNNIGDVDVLTMPEVEVKNQNGDMLLAFESIVEEEKVNLNAAAGTNNLIGTAVPAGKIWCITNAGGINATSATTRIFVYVAGLANSVLIADKFAPIAAEWVLDNGLFYLQAGDQVAAQFQGCTLNDDLYLRYAGYQMDAP